MPHPSRNGPCGYEGATETSQEGEGEQLHRFQTPGLKREREGQHYDSKGDEGFLPWLVSLSKWLVFLSKKISLFSEKVWEELTAR